MDLSTSTSPQAVVLTSLTLVAIGVAFSIWWRLGIERTIVWASVRAAVQLLAAGFVLLLVVDSTPLAWSWIAVMVLVAAISTGRRSRRGRTVVPSALLAIGGSTAVALAIVFGLGLLPAEPIALVVTAGITIGNTLPATILATDQSNDWRTVRRGELEALLALGFGRGGVARFTGADVARRAVLPQVERTKVVGLIALPGAMTGLLLAGVDPTTAVVAQLAIMYLILGSVVVSVAVVTITVLRGLLTDDLRIA